MRKKVSASNLSNTSARVRTSAKQRPDSPKRKLGRNPLQAKVRVRCHNAVNGFGAANSFSRRHTPNPASSGNHNRMDECGGCDIAVRGVAGA
jgi:hypothetical protein